MIKLTDILKEHLQFNHIKYNYYVRWTKYIDKDLKRNWSSWNYGEDGFSGTKENLINTIEKEYKKRGKNAQFCISWQCFYGDKLNEIEVIENLDINKTNTTDIIISNLYNNYWVLVDTRIKGISGHLLPNDILNINDAIELIKTNTAYQGGGFGDTIDGRKSEVIYSSEDKGKFGYHILKEIK